MTVPFISVALLNIGDVTIDPLSVPFVADVVGANSQIYEYLMTIQAMGGITGGLIAARVGLRLSPVWI